MLYKTVVGVEFFRTSVLEPDSPLNIQALRARHHVEFRRPTVRAVFFYSTPSDIIILEQGICGYEIRPRCDRTNRRLLLVKKWTSFDCKMDIVLAELHSGLSKINYLKFRNGQ